MSSRPSRGAARLAAILDALPDGLVLVNCNGTVVNANTIALELFETPGTALVGRGLLDLLPGFDSRLIPGSMRRPEAADERGRTKPTRMVARRTDGTEFPVEVTSAGLEDGREAYDSHNAFTGDELLMLVVRDLSGTMDTEAELARSRRQTEMILRAAAEGVVGTDTEGRVVLVNPAAAQILGFRASDLGGQELHPLILHSRADGEPFPYAESPLADTLRSGRKHRVRGQVLWAKDGSRVPVDLTTAPVRDGDQLVGAVMTFTDRRPFEAVAERHEAELAQTSERLRTELAETTERLTAELADAEERFAAELADRSERHSLEIEHRDEDLLELSGRHEQLTAVLGESLRGPLEELRTELSTLAADPAGQLWPEANQILHHLAAGYARMTTLIDNVLGFQRLNSGQERLTKSNSLLDAVVATGIEGAIELIGPGRVQFAVHAPSIEAEVDAGRLATALAHLAADVAGVDSTGKTRLLPDGGYVDSTVVVAAAQRGEVVRIEVRGPFAGGDPVHEPIVRGIVEAHGGVLQTHEVPGMSGSAYVLEVPIGEGAGASGPAPAGAGPEVSGVAAGPAGQPEVPVQAGGVGVPAGDIAVSAGGVALPAGQQPVAPVPVPPAAPVAAVDGGTLGDGIPSGATLPGEAPGSGRRRARRGSTDAFLESAVPMESAAPAEGTGGDAGGTGDSGAEAERPTGRRRAAHSGPAAAEPGAERAERADGVPGEDEWAGAAEAEAGAVPLIPGQDTGRDTGSGGTGRRRGRPSPAEESVPDAAGTLRPSGGSVVTAAEGAAGRPAFGQAVPPQGVPVPAQHQHGAGAPHGGRPELAAATSPAPASASAPGAQAALPEGKNQSGRRARRALAPAPTETAAEAGTPRSAFALPPAEADRPAPAGATAGGALPGGHDQAADARTGTDRTPPQPHPVPTGRRRAGPGPDETGGYAGQRYETAGAEGPGAVPGQGAVPGGPGAVPHGPGAVPETPGGVPGMPGAVAEGPGAVPAPMPAPVPGEGGPATGSLSLPLPELQPMDEAPADGGTGSVSLPLPAETPVPAPLPADASHGRAFSVRTLGQGAPFAQQIADKQSQQVQQIQGQSGQGGQSGQSGQGQASLGSGRRRKLATPPEAERTEPSSSSSSSSSPASASASPSARPQPQGAPVPSQGVPRLPVDRAEGRSYAIGAPERGAAEGPEPLDGPGGAVEVANRPQPHPVDDELPPEPLDNPRRLLVWPAPDVSTQQALSERGYRPVVVHSREEVDAQIAAFPAALFVDPLTGPITRTALQSLRQAAVAAEVPVLVTAGLGQATREAAYGADPAVLLKALAPRDSEQHPPRVLLIEEHEEIALALTATLERRGMQVARATADADAVTLASQMRPNLVVMDLMQVRRRRAGIIDWLRANGQLNRTPLVVYTSAGLNRAELPRLASGETVLFLAERSTSGEVQARIVDLLAKIGTN
ncbi:PAS domain-containing protein [Streptomyces sp. CAU 1734]|uniref:PAS domain-containing protein n=1 Tax=Streptomyces sp. CAU 1734 TaxID=3140360 RepID=UPI003261C3C5